MKNKLPLIIIAILSFTQATFADTVTTKDGSILNGTITLIDKGIIHIDTPYAGNLKIKQEDVVSFETNSPIFVRLENGITIPGTVTSTGNDMLRIQAEDNTITANTTDVKASWTPDKIDPEIERNRRKWRNDLAFDLSGRSGNVDRFSLGVKLDLRLKGPNDELLLSGEYEQAEEDDNKTEDRAFGRIGYERFGSKKLGWFVGNSLETNPINDIYFRSTTNAGISYRWINEEDHTLIIRNGLGYRYTDFEDDDTDNESTATIKMGLSHTYKYKDWFYLENNLSYSPALEDFDNYTAFHDSSIRIPIDNGENFWIRMGIRNEYESETSADEKLDTHYYTQLIYSWQ